jgi:hypothetical protein
MLTLLMTIGLSGKTPSGATSTDIAPSVPSPTDVPSGKRANAAPKETQIRELFSRYFDNINHRHYREAFLVLTPRMQEAVGGLAIFTEGLSTSTMMLDEPRIERGYAVSKPCGQG